MAFSHKTGLTLIATLWGACVVPAAAQTQIEEVVVYGIDGDTNELLRYTFDTDTFEVIGVVQTAGGDVVENTEALTWVPTGPAKGMYCIPRNGALTGELLKVNPFDGSAEVIYTCPWDDIVGMVTIKIAGNWVILAWDYNDRELIAVDPEALTSVLLFSGGPELEGLAAGPDGTLYGNTDTDLYTFDLAGNFTHVGSCGTSKMESLEYGFGDVTAEIVVPGIDPTWTQDGILMGFDDGESLRVIDPATGNSQEFSPCAFASVDCEGIVVLTQLQDPNTEVLDPSGD